MRVATPRFDDPLTMLGLWRCRFPAAEERRPGNGLACSPKGRFVAVNWCVSSWNRSDHKEDARPPVDRNLPLTSKEGASFSSARIAWKDLSPRSAPGGKIVTPERS
jgi:hypothetical protein